MRTPLSLNALSLSMIDALITTLASAGRSGSPVTQRPPRGPVRRASWTSTSALSGCWADLVMPSATGLITGRAGAPGAPDTQAKILPDPHNPIQSGKVQVRSARPSPESPPAPSRPAHPVEAAVGPGFDAAQEPARYDPMQSGCAPVRGPAPKRGPVMPAAAPFAAQVPASPHNLMQSGHTAPCVIGQASAALHAADASANRPRRNPMQSGYHPDSAPAANAEPALRCDAAVDPRGNDPMQSRRGRLKNGAPGGDPSLAPRCGARTRAGHPCRAPAMKNGRCRMHGGASTGPRTKAGLERMRQARTKHGYYGGEGQAFLRSISALLADGNRLVALAKAERGKAPAGEARHDLMQSGETALSPSRRQRRREPVSTGSGDKIRRDGDTNVTALLALRLLDDMATPERNNLMQSGGQLHRRRNPVPECGTDGQHDPRRGRRQPSGRLMCGETTSCKAAGNFTGRGHRCPDAARAGSTNHVALSVATG